MNKKLILNTSYNILNLGVSYILPIITIPMFIASQSVATYGKVSIIFSITGAIASIVQYNLDNIAPSLKKSLNNEYEFIGGFVVIRFILFTISFFIGFLIVFIFYADIINLYIISTLSIFGLIFNTSHVLISNERFNLIARYGIITKIISFGGVFYSCYIYKSVELFVFFSNVWMTLQSIINYKITNTIPVINKYKIKKIIKLTYQSFLSGVVNIPAAFAIQPLVGVSGGYYVAGIFSIYDKFMKVIINTFNSFFIVLLARNENIKSKINTNILNDNIKNLLLIITTLTALLIIFNSQFSSLGEYFNLPSWFNFLNLSLSVITIVFIIFGNYIGIVILTRLLLFKSISISVITAASISFPIIFLLTKEFNVTGAIIGLLIGEVISCLLKISFAKIKLKSI